MVICLPENVAGIIVFILTLEKAVRQCGIGCFCRQLCRRGRFSCDGFADSLHLCFINRLRLRFVDVAVDGRGGTGLNVCRLGDGLHRCRLGGQRRFAVLEHQAGADDSAAHDHHRHCAGNGARYLRYRRAAVGHQDVYAALKQPEGHKRQQPFGVQLDAVLFLVLGHALLQGAFGIAHTRGDGADRNAQPL